MLERVYELMSIGPLVPASIMMLMLGVYCLITLFGFIDLDLDAPDLDLDVDVDADFDLDAGVGISSVGGFGTMTIRWLNLSRIPIALWGGCFILIWWSVSVAFWLLFDKTRFADATLFINLLLSGRSAIVAVPITKFVTNPMTKWFETSRYYPENIVGQECEISTGEATPQFGQARYKTDAAPLLLNIRTDGATLKKGDKVKIIDFDKEKRIYTVTNVQPEMN